MSDNTCPGTGTIPAQSFRGTGALFGVLIGTCTHCGKSVKCRKGTNGLNRHAN